MSTNEVHPRTALPHIDIYQSDCPVWDHCYTVAYEDRVAFAFWQGSPRTGGALVLDCMESKIIMPYMLAADVAFLSRDEALLLFNGEGDHGISIAIYSFQLQQITCECQFPFSESSSLALFLTRPDSRFGDDCPSSIAKSLLPDSETNILALTIQLESHGRPACCVLSVQMLRQMCNSLLGKNPDRNVFRWEEWGPTVTRWLPYQVINATGNRNIFGSRMIAWGNPGYLHEDSYDETCLILLDFNPRPIKRGATTRLEDYHEIVIDKETTWKNPQDGTLIASSLPYRAFTRRWFPRCSYFRFDGGTIIGKGVSAFFRCHYMVSFLTFPQSQWDKYHFYSFLPLESSEEQEKEESGIGKDVA
ncbi:11915_t:CDS:2 [Acaulospora colombiana]|uniref:11915_t:CDS:1 n=1 Tax=Acaulospora colombiana TaxID=27376 RepID=A0ACA9NF23_9GLOM|nr:11915_t:CDS:2 [Acaulospora colombiana]